LLLGDDRRTPETAASFDPDGVLEPEVYSYSGLLTKFVHECLGSFGISQKFCVDYA
jgi:hypothetical protein